MRKVIKKILSFGVLLGICFTVGGCEIKKGDSSDGYSADIGMPAHEYNVYFTEEITTVLNQLTKRMSGAKQVYDGAATTEEEIIGTEYSITVVEECLNQIKMLNPGEYYSSDAEYTIATIENTIEILNEYKECLKSNGKNEVLNYSKRLQVMFNNLSSTINSIYK